ncbi:hypothetical protein BDF14DRAFT_1951004 [Spinellus fusiger]|nr:hypothetical protein BDF14DRAFT_1951004 [Spinellus fusiger]
MNCNNLLDVDQHFNQLLCMSSVLVLQKRAARQDVIASLKSPYALDTKTYMSIKTIIQEYHENNISNLETRYSLIALAMKASGAERATVLAVESLFPSLKDLDVGPIVESELAASYIHPLIQALLSYDEEDKVARCSNIIPDNNTDVSRRPDYEVTVFEQYQPSYRTCYGEIKGEGFSSTSSIMDFYRLGVFAKLEIVASNLTGVLCFQALGPSVTFYTLTHPRSSIFTFVELVTINIPKTKNEIMSVMGILDELHKIAAYHRTIVKSLSLNGKHPTLPFEFVQGTRKTLPVKRKPSLGSISSK